MPQVSVIVPNYNHGRYLRKRLDTVYGQTFGDFEVILLDDASTDGSREILQSYATRPNTRFVANEHNSGSVFAQWNKGVQMARGELVWIAESDDYADARFLEVMESRLRQHPEADLAYCQSQIVDEVGTVLKKNDQWTDDLPKADRWRRDHVAEGRRECAHYLVRKCTIPNASAVLFRKSAYVQVGYADVEFRLSGDWLMWARMLMPSRLAFVAEPLNFFRRHAQTQRSRMAGSPQHQVEDFRVVMWISNHCRVARRTWRQVLDELAERFTQETLQSLLSDVVPSGDVGTVRAVRYMLARKYEWTGDGSLREGSRRESDAYYRQALITSQWSSRVCLKRLLLKAGLCHLFVRRTAAAREGFDRV